MAICALLSVWCIGLTVITAVPLVKNTVFTFFSEEIEAYCDNVRIELNDTGKFLYENKVGDVIYTLDGKTITTQNVLLGFADDDLHNGSKVTVYALKNYHDEVYTSLTPVYEIVDNFIFTFLHLFACVLAIKKFIALKKLKPLEMTEPNGKIFRYCSENAGSQ